MAENAEPPPSGPLVDLKTGNITEPWLRWLEARATSTTVQIGGLLSGFQRSQSNLSTEVSARIAGDAAIAGAGDGAGTSDSRVYSGKTSSATTWVTLSTLTVTPTAPAGDYTFTFSGDIPLGHLDNETGTTATFNGNWRIVEEENGGGTPVTLATGTFTATWTAEAIAGEGGGAITIPEFWVTIFNSIPASPLANNYDSIPVDLRFEIQRASGSNEIITSGLSGTFGVSWAP